MKLKHLFAALLLLSFTLTANAQWENTIPKANVSLGFGGGLNYSFVKSSSTSLNSDFEGLAGFNGGVMLNIRFLPRDAWGSASTGLLAIQPEARLSYTSFDSRHSYLDLIYITVPVMFQVYPAKCFYIEAGPEFSLNIAHAPEKYTLDNSTLSLSKLKANDFMLGVGTGVRLKWFMLGARYNLGLSDFASNLPWRQSYVQINIGFLFELGKKGF